jgi:hypothetical protein
MAFLYIFNCAYTWRNDRLLENLPQIDPPITILITPAAVRAFPYEAVKEL